MTLKPSRSPSRNSAHNLSREFSLGPSQGAAPGSEKKARVIIGLRNIKTTISVLICLLFYHFMDMDGVMIACVSAIICMQDSVEKSLTNGKNRLQSIGIGTVIAMAFRYVNRGFPNAYLEMISVGVGIMTVIMICNLLKRNSAIIMGCVVFLSIMLGGGDTDPFVYSVSQLLNTLFGVAVAVLVNYFVLNPARKGSGGAAPKSGAPKGGAPKGGASKGTAEASRARTDGAATDVAYDDNEDNGEDGDEDPDNDEDKDKDEDEDEGM